MIDTNIENENTSPSRPNRHDLAVRQAAAEKTWPAFRAWLIANDATETEADEDRETALHELADALEWNEDGYDVAQHLERQGWDADDGLVDAARRLLDALYVAHDAAVKAWGRDDRTAADLQARRPRAVRASRSTAAGRRRGDQDRRRASEVRRVLRVARARARGRRIARHLRRLRARDSGECVICVRGLLPSVERRSVDC